MNIIDEDFARKDEKKSNLTTVILVLIVISIIAIVAISTYLMYLESTKLKVAVNGQYNEQIKKYINITEDGKVYMPIKEIAPFLGYEGYKGESNDISEDISKCYVKNENEIANFTLNENKIYKIDLTENQNKYEYIYSNEKIWLMKEYCTHLWKR